MIYTFQLDKQKDETSNELVSSSCLWHSTTSRDGEPESGAFVPKSHAIDDILKQTVSAE